MAGSVAGAVRALRPASSDAEGRREPPLHNGAYAARGGGWQPERAPPVIMPTWSFTLAAAAEALKLSRDRREVLFFISCLRCSAYSARFSACPTAPVRLFIAERWLDAKVAGFAEVMRCATFAGDNGFVTGM